MHLLIIYYSVLAPLFINKVLASRPMDPASNQLSIYKKTVMNKTFVTLKTGAPAGLLTAVETIGEHGPVLMQDFEFLDSMSSFDRERIPERVVHAKGGGAFGYFITTNDITNICAAKIFEFVGKQTPVAARFSTVVGETGSADSNRDPRGFAIKFYTDEGNWDIVGLNTPTFFIRDPRLFPFLIHSRKRNPVTHLFDPNMYWDFVTQRPEAVRQEVLIQSDNGIPFGFRYMNGFGVHAFKFVNNEGNYNWVKFHFISNQGLQNVNAEEARQLASDDPDYAIKDLYNAIETENYPSWTLHIQVMSPIEAEGAPFNPFDVTKEWPIKDFPLIPVGKLVLNRNPENYFDEVEQIAFSPANFVPGVGPSIDKMLHGRIFSYGDTQRHRLGANFLQLQVNKPKLVKVYNYQRDGPQCDNSNNDGAPNYYPNTFGGPNQSNRTINLATKIFVKGYIGNYDTGDEDNYSQATEVYLGLPVDERKRVAANIASTLGRAIPDIQTRVVTLFTRVHPDLGADLAQQLKN